MTHKCPNCGIRLKVVLFQEQDKYNKAIKQRGTFQSTQIAPPVGRIRSLLWFMWGNRYRPPNTEPILVRSEIKTTRHQLLIRELEIPATEDELRLLADLYVRRGEGWARETSRNEINMSNHKHNRIKDAFLHLEFLRQTTPTQYELTEAGTRFLSLYLQTSLAKMAYPEQTRSSNNNVQQRR